METFVFRCPTTDLRVQYRLDNKADAASEEEYEGISCPACAKLHFVNRKTRKLLGREHE